MQRIDAPAVQLLVRAAQRDVSWIMAGSARLRRATLSILRNSIEQGCLDLDPTSEFLPLLLTRATYAIARQAHNSTSGERASSLDAFGEAFPRRVADRANGAVESPADLRPHDQRPSPHQLLRGFSSKCQLSP